VIHTYSLHHRIREYRWPCGCRATGNDPRFLDVRYCRTHHVVVGSSATMTTDV
jgi:hypothetical protein